MDPARVESIIANSQRLMSPQGQRLIENRERGKLGKKPLPNATPSAYDEKPYNYQPQPYVSQQQYQQAPVTKQFQNEALRESFEKMPPIQIDTMGYGASGYQPGQSIIQEQQQYQPQPQYQQPVYSQPQYAPSNGGFDYNMIKTMINEAIRENLGYIKERLQENELRGIRMNGGNKIQFLDNKGNLYEGTLTIKKKAQ